MHRYEELERLYYKKLILKFFIALGIISLFVGGFFLLKKSKKKEPENEIKKEIKKDIKTKKEQPKNIKKEIKKEHKVKKETKINKEEKKEVKSFHFILPDISEIKTSKEVKKEIKPKKEPKKELKKEIQKPKSNNKIKEVQLNHTANLDIKITEKKVDLKTLIKKFNQTQDFDLAILIAKEYFKKGDLKNAQIWALTANNINPNSYKSWVLFADILQKEKKIKKAKEILKVYINSYGQNDIIEQKLRSLNDK